MKKLIDSEFLHYLNEVDARTASKLLEHLFRYSESVNLDQHETSKVITNEYDGNVCPECGTDVIRRDGHSYCRQCNII